MAERWRARGCRNAADEWQTRHRNTADHVLEDVFWNYLLSYAEFDCSLYTLQILFILPILHASNAKSHVEDCNIYPLKICLHLALQNLNQIR